jgi:mono/diheme cytochrome c family protein
MKMILALVGVALIIVFAEISFGQVEVREGPLTWKQAGITDGGELYSELCAVCHGTSGMGDGPAAPALKKRMPDLTGLAVRNDGVFPRDRVEDLITGRSRVIEHGTIDMPIWGDAFEGVRPDWKPFRRKALARQRIHNLTEYLATIQAE